MENQIMVFDTPQQINFVRLVALRGALSLELKGMKRRGRSAYSIIKHEFGLKGNRNAVYTQFCELVEKERSRL